MMVTCVPTKRWTLTLPKLDEPFGARFHFENFLREPVSVDARIILLVEYDETLYIRPYIELGTLRARVVCMGVDNVVILSLYQTMTRKQRFR
jgi:hypothetical protein